MTEVFNYKSTTQTNYYSNDSDSDVDISEASETNESFKVDKASLRQGRDEALPDKPQEQFVQRPSTNVKRMSTLAAAATATAYNHAHGLTDIAHSDSEESEGDDEVDDLGPNATANAHAFEVKRESVFKQNLKYQAVATRESGDAELEQELSALDAHGEGRQRGYTNTVDRNLVKAHKNGTMTMMEPSLLKLCKSNMKSTKQEQQDMLREILKVGRQSVI